MFTIGPSKPSLELLCTSAPEEVWARVEEQAIRSPMIRFKVGAIIWDPARKKVVGRGCSHPDIQFSRISASVHAERHALRQCNHHDLTGHWCIIYTLNGRGGCAWSSRPCFGCASTLYKRGIERVVYAERVSDYKWLVLSEHPEELISRAPPPTGDFAREQRIPALANNPIR